MKRFSRILTDIPRMRKDSRILSQLKSYILFLKGSGTLYSMYILAKEVINDILSMKYLRSLIFLNLRLYSSKLSESILTLYCPSSNIKNCKANSSMHRAALLTNDFIQVEVFFISVYFSKRKTEGKMQSESTIKKESERRRFTRIIIKLISLIISMEHTAITMKSAEVRKEESSAIFRYRFNIINMLKH